MSDLTVAEISAMLRANADSLARQLLPAGRYEGGGTEWKCSAGNSPTGDAISVHISHDSKQGVCGFWNQVPPGGDILDLIGIAHGLDKRGAVEWAKDWLNLGGQEPHATRKNLAQRRRSNRSDEHAAEESENKRATAERIWRLSGELAGAGTAYLKHRGLDPFYVDGRVLRFHEGLPHPEGGTFPALVAKVTNVDDEFLGIWRIYLKINGDGKAPVSTPKLGLGSVKGGAVRLGGLWPEIGAAEGIETAIAVRQLIHRQTQRLLPIWSTLSAAGMRGLELPDDVTTLRVYADGDAIRWSKTNVVRESPGISAMDDLIARVCGHDLPSGVRRLYRREVPPTGQDWLDVLNETEKHNDLRNVSRAA